MEVSIQNLPKSKLELRIKIPFEEFSPFIEEAIFNLGKSFQIKGFRKGHLPKEIIEKEVGRERILKEAAERACRKKYVQAILENKIEAVSSPDIKILRFPDEENQKTCFEFKAEFFVLPEINLADYKKIAKQVKRNKISVQEEEIEKELKLLQKSRAKLSQIDREARKGDFIEISYQSSQIEGGKVFTDGFILGEGHFVVGFEQKLEGMKAGDEKEFSLNIPKFNKEINFKVKINSVQKVELSEINDEFAAKLGNFENLAALKQSIKQGLILEKEELESQRVCGEILEKTAEKSNFEIPEILIEREVENRLDNLKQQVSRNLKIPFEEYLSKLNKTEKEIKDSFLEDSRKTVRNFLVLREIGKRENIQVSEEELEKELNKTLSHYSSVEEVKKKLDLDQLKEYIKGGIRNKKVFEKLLSFQKISN